MELGQEKNHGDTAAGPLRERHLYSGGSALLLYIYIYIYISIRSHSGRSAQGTL